jgi:hypothetical protein
MPKLAVLAPDRLTLRITVLLPGINFLLELFQLVPFVTFLREILAFFGQKMGEVFGKMCICSVN